jgi:ABC-type branched-subunit amino acid transport system substrate-binding protein
MKPFFPALILTLSLGATLGVPGVALAGDEGVTASEIRLGASVVLTGPLGPQTLDYGAGSRMYFDSVNERGGVNGRKIVYTTLDDGFDVARAVENTKKLIQQDKVFMIYNNTGTAHTAAILPLADSSRTVVFGPVTGAAVLRDKFDRHLFHVRASYVNEAQKIVSQLKRMGITRIGAFYQDDVMGTTLLNAVRLAAQQEKITLTGEFKVDPKQADYKTAAEAAAKATPQAIVMCTAGMTFPNFVKAVQGTELKPTYYGFSVASLDVLNKVLGANARGIVLAQIMPSLKNTAVPVVLEFRKVFNEKHPGATPSASQYEGYIHARLLVDGLRRAGTNLTTESFIRAMESSGEISYGPFKAHYAPQNHNGSSYVELAIVDSTGQLRF